MNNTGQHSQLEIYNWLLARLSQDLNLPINEIDPNAPLMKLNLTSSLVIIMVQDLESYLGVTLKPVVLFNNPNVNMLSKALYEISLKDDIQKPNLDLKDMIDKDVEVHERCTSTLLKEKPSDNQDVLLTGADGILGCNVLLQLLMQS